MEEHGMYFAKKEFYEVIRENGGVWNDSKERPIVCLIKSVECPQIYWAIPVGNYEHRDKSAKERIKKYLNFNKKDIRSCFYHIGNTNEKSIFFISDVVPFTEEYVDREYLNKSKKIHIIKNKVLLSELEYKLSRILEFEKRKPNYFRQHITDIKHYFIRKVSGAAGALHHHPHTQITYVVLGKFEFTIGDEIMIVEAGDTMLQMDDIVHGCKCIEKGIILDIFTPMRDDFVE